MRNNKEEFKTVKDLASAYKEMIEAFDKKIPTESKGLLTWVKLVQYLGYSMDIISNRKLALGNCGRRSKTLKNILGSKRRKILVKALKEYDNNTYGDLTIEND